MKVSELILKVANGLISFVIILSLSLAGLYAAYALWDNSLIYAAVDDAQADMLKLKPQEDKPTFDELLAINPDVQAWLTLDNTNIDYPVLQGETNLNYINTDVYGNFALAGSIFLDSRNDGDFYDTYSLLYGHHMDNGKMFGDLSLYKEEAFFKENKTGTLILPDRVYKLEIYACLLVSSSEEAIFNPKRWQDNIDDLLQFADSNALYLNEVAIENAMNSTDGDPQILALTTCSSEFTDARTVILAVMEPYVQQQNRTVE
ncbi:sortase B [Alkalibaculum bacchi]|uniref:Sortase B n=1 Tax=Alkalibaculum bacchi TaxID=645887 RepID=A0A366I859_9FIRM|nr:class B sortase [Alkalibaculum bacchi]RBP64491.1 sortase B [Alkalibaculum bacchi]